jgi:sugar/nucleoside kinase (ribokinase family)
LGPEGYRVDGGPGGSAAHHEAPDGSLVVRDTTGAGDAFAAGWLVGGPGLAVGAAEECIARVGAAPPAPLG